MSSSFLNTKEDILNFLSPEELEMLQARAALAEQAKKLKFSATNTTANSSENTPKSEDELFDSNASSIPVINYSPTGEEDDEKEDEQRQTSSNLMLLQETFTNLKRTDLSKTLHSTNSSAVPTEKMSKSELAENEALVRQAVQDLKNRRQMSDDAPMHPKIIVEDPLIVFNTRRGDGKKISVADGVQNTIIGDVSENALPILPPQTNLPSLIMKRFLANKIFNALRSVISPRKEIKSPLKET